MKIVGFESNEGLRLGVVDGDNVIDLQAVDAKVPSNLADVLAQSKGDLKALGDIAKKAPASARKPLKGLKFGLPVSRPPKNICLGLNYWSTSRKASIATTCRNSRPSSSAARPRWCRTSSRSCGRRCPTRSTTKPRWWS